MRRFSSLLCALLVALGAGCGKDDQSTPPQAPTPPANARSFRAAAVGWNYPLVEWIAPSMVPGGTVQSARILNLCPTKCYWIGLRVFDPVDGCSDLSEILAITTRSRPTPSPLVEVPAGKFVMGSGPEEFAPEEESPETVLDLAAFAIEATEVTNAQYAVFMEEGGDARPEYWSDAGWVWRESNGITRPLFWDSGVYRCGLAEVRCTIRNAAGTCPCD